MEAKDPDGGQEELWLTLESMGYSRKLNLIKVKRYLYRIWVRNEGA